MRKALQAEQSKAEMLIKIQNIEDDCAGLDDDVDDLKRRINRLLKEEKEDKQRALDDHQHDVG
jgi:vacuolar-type H+-ATPase subunit D/Vma8